MELQLFLYSICICKRQTTERERELERDLQCDSEHLGNVLPGKKLGL